MKTKLTFYLILSQFIVFSLKSQSWVHYPWDSVPKFEKRMFDEARDFFYNTYKNNIYVGDLNENYATYHCAGFYTDYTSGNIYPNFYGYEAYIKSILYKIIKDKNIVDKIKIFFYYNDEFNASMDALGNLRLNIGSFNYLNNEAELAGILAHEYGHLFNKDMLDKPTTSKQQEAAADYMAIKYINLSPYSTKGLSSVLKAFKRFEVKQELKLGENKVQYYSHPDPGDRIKQVKILSNDSSITGKRMFLVDSLRFFELKKIASQESFNLMFTNRKFHNLIELSFVKYLYEPENQENLAVLLESLRRYLFLNPNDLSSQFIIHQYKGPGAKSNDYYKYITSNKTSILNYLNKGLLFLPSSDLTKIQATELLDSVNVRFKTYNEALIYFTKKSEQLNCKPCEIGKIFKNPDEIIFNREIKNNNSVFSCNDYLNAVDSGLDFKNSLYVFNFPHFDDLNYFDVNTPNPYGKVLNNYINTFKKENNQQKIYLINEMSFSDQHIVNSFNDMVEDVVPKNLYQKTILNKSSPYEDREATTHFVHDTKKWTYFAPELYALFYKYKVKQIFIIDFDYVHLDKYSSIGPAMVNTGPGNKKCRAWKFKIISLSDLNNVLYYHNIRKTVQTTDESILECSENFKSFIKSNR